MESTIQNRLVTHYCVTRKDLNFATLMSSVQQKINKELYVDRATESNLEHNHPVTQIMPDILSQTDNLIVKIKDLQK